MSEANKMKAADLAMLLVLAGLWGASYLFMRLGAGEFGALPMAGARAAGAALLLLPLSALRGEWTTLRRHWKRIAIVGLANSALPFVLFGFAALTINAGLSAIFNAATPLYAALIGWRWLGQPIGTQRGLGLAVGFAGVLWLAWDGAGFKHGAGGIATVWAILACLAATLMYAFSAHYSKQKLQDVPPMAVTSGSQLVSAVALALPALWYWPAQAPSAHAWGALAMLIVMCTAVAYALYYRLIARVGAARTMSVPFLVPAFGVLWGVLFLHERFDASMAAGSALIVFGVALTNGLISLPLRGAKAQTNLS